MYLMVIVLNAIIFNMFKLYYYYYANIHPMVILLLLLLLLFEQIDQMSLTIVGFCFPFPKVSQLPSNLFISVVDDNGGLFFIFL